MKDSKRMPSHGKKRKNFIPRAIGSANFANGSSFLVEQVNPKGGCRITDKEGNFSYSRSEAKAWASVRYMGKIAQQSERSAS